MVAELRDIEQANGTGGVAGRRDDLPLHVPHFHNIAVGHGAVDRAGHAPGGEILVAGFLDKRRVNGRRNDGRTRGLAQLGGGAGVVEMGMGEHDGVQFALAQSRQNLVSRAAGIHHHGAFAVGDDIHVVGEHAHDHILDIDAQSADLIQIRRHFSTFLA